MRYQFPRTLKAAEASERSQWAIGDSLLSEADDKQTGPRGLRAVEKELEANGVGLSVAYLSALRRTAKTFPASRRHALPWKVHEAAGNPDTLDVIVRAAKKTGDKVTIWHVADVLKQMRDTGRDERLQAKAAALKEQEKAEAEERRARERERLAKAAAETERTRKSVAERRAAERDRREAVERRRAAAEKVKSIPMRPTPHRDRNAPSEDEVPMMVVTTALMSAASEVAHIASKTEKDLDHYLAELSPKMIAALIESWMSSVNTCTRIVATLRKAAPKGAHLSVVNE